MVSKSKVVLNPGRLAALATLALSLGLGMNTATMAQYHPGYQPPAGQQNYNPYGTPPPQRQPGGFQGRPQYQHAQQQQHQQQQQRQGIPPAGQGPPPSQFDGRNYNTPEYDSANIQTYTDYSDQGSRYYQQGQLTKAIEMFEKALPLAPQASVPVIYNNLAAAYIKRGNYFNEQARQYEGALSDFREALYWLDSGWPEGMDRKELHKRNLKAARENLDIAYRNLKINPHDQKVHMQLARKLRVEGKFRQAVVEYARAYEIDDKNTEALQAMGDLFNVLNNPHKSNKYYQKIANTDGAEVSDDLLVQLGNSQYRAGQIDEAVVSFNKALARNSKNASALNQLERIWQNEIKFNPRSVLGHANLAGVYQKQGNFDKAFQQYNVAEHFAEQEPSTSFEVKKLIRLNIGTLFQDRGDYEMALKAYNTVLHAEPNHKEANFYKATALEDSGNFQKALETYNHLLSLDPDYPRAKRRMFGLIKKQSEPEKLALGLKEYADRFSQDATIQAQIGEEFHQMKNYEEAERYYQRAIRLNPKSASAHANLGAVYQAQGRDEESIQAYNQARKIDPDNEVVANLSQNVQSSLAFRYFQQGIESQQQGDLQAALGHYRRALEITPENSDLLAAYGVALQNDGQIDKAIEHYNKALKKDPHNGAYHYYIGTAHHQKNDLSEALASYKKAVDLDDTQDHARQAIAGLEQQQVAEDLNRAIEAFNARKYNDALSTINKALSGDASNATAHYYKGLILNELKKPDQALQSYREATRLDPDFADAYYASGIILDDKDDEQGARTAFQKFIELSNGNEDDFVRYAKDRLQALSP